MSINLKRSQTLDGTAADTIAVNPDYKKIQIAISGRTTGIITVTGTADGGEAAEAITNAAGDPLTIDLTTEYTAVIEGFALTELTFTPSATGDDYLVTINQWPV